jgi:hypothetical protein
MGTVRMWGQWHVRARVAVCVHVVRRGPPGEGRGEKGVNVVITI